MPFRRVRPLLCAPFFRVQHAEETKFVNNCRDLDWARYHPSIVNVQNAGAHSKHLQVTTFCRCLVRTWIQICAWDPCSHTEDYDAPPESDVNKGKACLYKLTPVAHLEVSWILEESISRSYIINTCNSSRNVISPIQFLGGHKLAGKIRCENPSNAYP